MAVSWRESRPFPNILKTNHRSPNSQPDLSGVHMRLVLWGTYDLQKPRTRIVLRGLRACGVDVHECHADIWRGIEDKSMIASWVIWLKIIVRWLLSYPRLILRFLMLPKPHAVMVGYMGHLDVLVLWLFARLRGTPVVWDAFLSLYNTLVEERRVVKSGGLLARLVFVWEWLACRAADLILLDTQAHVAYFGWRFGIPPQRLGHIPIGVETERFPVRSSDSPSPSSHNPFTVLFFGQLNPWHGIETIVQAAQFLDGEAIRWVILGQGPEDRIIREALARRRLKQLTWIPWVPYEQLIGWIHRAHVCLGIFGDSIRAGIVIPNKVFQILSTGVPLITRDSAAIRELLTPDMPGVFLVPPADAEALAQMIRHLSSQPDLLNGRIFHREVVRTIEPAAIGRRLVSLLQGMVDEVRMNS